MNSKPVALNYFLPVAFVACFSIILLSWGGQKQTPQQKSEQSITDTVPKNKADKKIRDLDDVLDELDRAELKVDMEKVNEQLKEAMKQIDRAKIQMEIDKALKDVDMEKIRAEVNKVTNEIDAAKIEKEMENAKASIEKAKVDMKEYKGFVDGLEKDGLVNKKEGYTIQHKNDELIINGKKQPADVYNKYRTFLKKHEKFTIKKSDDDFNIYNDDDH